MLIFWKTLVHYSYLVLILLYCLLSSIQLNIIAMSIVIFLHVFPGAVGAHFALHLEIFFYHLALFPYKQTLYLNHSPDKVLIQCHVTTW